MSKGEVKKRLLRAIEEDPHRKCIKKVSIFGSYAYGRPNKRSDVDILIEFTPGARVGYFKLFDIQENMRKHLKIKVDLVTRGALDKYIKNEVLANAQTVYQKR